MVILAKVRDNQAHKLSTDFRHILDKNINEHELIWDEYWDMLL